MNRSEILSMVGIKYHDRTVEGVGELRLKEMSGGDRDEYFSLLAKADKIKFFDKEENKEVEVPDIKGVKPFVISKCLVDEKNKALFTEEEIGSTFTPESMDAIFDVISDINGIEEDSIDNAEKN